MSGVLRKNKYEILKHWSSLRPADNHKHINATYVANGKSLVSCQSPNKLVRGEYAGIKEEKDFN
jgi:hypothetical protein